MGVVHLSLPKPEQEMNKGDVPQAEEIILTRFPMASASFKKKKKKTSFYPQSAQLCKPQSPNMANFLKVPGQRP